MARSSRDNGNRDNMVILFMGAGFILRPFFMRKIALGLENMAEGFRILFGYKIQIIFSVFLCLF